MPTPQPAATQTVESETDPYDVKKIAIPPWFRSPTQFGYEALSTPV